jgi:drug/metabolite transporter (DMT)-like permease
VAPFALLVPFVGALSSSAVFGERFGPLRLTGMGFVLLGLVLIALPAAAERNAIEHRTLDDALPPAG